MITQIIGDFFKKNKIEVHYSIEDNDDTIAYYAIQDGAAVLSKDKDFWRYIPELPCIYRDFFIDNDKLIFRHQKVFK